jgi:hypothetical protein
MKQNRRRYNGRPLVRDVPTGQEGQTTPLTSSRSGPEKEREHLRMNRAERTS